MQPKTTKICLWSCSREIIHNLVHTLLPLLTDSNILFTFSAESPDQLEVDQKATADLIKQALQRLSSSSGFEEELCVVNSDRFIVTAAKLQELKGNQCECGQLRTFKYKSRGCVITLDWACEGGHSGQWTSSEIVTLKSGNPVYANDLLWCASTFVSGNNYYKLQLLGQFLNLKMPEYSTFARYMNFYFCSEVDAMWQDMRSIIYDVLKPLSIRICGDGRCDSPGFSARYLTYVLMEQSLGLVLDMEIMDCRQSGGVSTTMEVKCFVKCIKRICEQLNVRELWILNSSQETLLNQNMYREKGALRSKYYLLKCFLI